MSDSATPVPPSAPARIGYVVKRFPRLSETFIINELRALRALGVHIEVFSLLPPEQAQQTALLAELDLPVFDLPTRESIAELPIEQRNHATGARRQHRLRHWLREAPAGAVEPLFPGKRPSQCTTLQMQAAALSCLATMRGIRHLHAHFASDAATVAMLAGRLSGLPWSMTAHAKDIYHTYSHRQWDRAFLRTKLNEACFTVTVSDYNLDYLKQLAPLATVHRLYNGVDLQRLQPHQGPRDAGLIVGVARLVEKKGFRDLIDACATLRQRQIDFRCVIIGEGPEREALQRRIEQLGLGDRIELPGSLPQQRVLDWLRRATVFALPCVVSASGDRDGLPTVLLESMALGTPAISTRVAGIPEMIDDGDSGWLVEPDNPPQLAATLGVALRAPAGERQRLARNARRKAESLFNLHDNVRGLNALFATRGGNVVQHIRGTG